MRLAAVGLAVQAASAFAQPGPVFVVRHAERASDPKGDPALSAEGVVRAELLAQMLAAADVRHIITTHYRRTQDTAAPLARTIGVTPTIVPVRPGQGAAHVPEVLAEVRKATGAVLVVGHSNTVAGIVAGLSGRHPLALCETTYANLFVVAQPGTNQPPVQLKYGKPDPQPEPGCQ